jgi:hypothetical protein
MQNVQSPDWVRRRNTLWLMALASLMAFGALAARYGGEDDKDPRPAAPGADRADEVPGGHTRSLAPAASSPAPMEWPIPIV